MSESVAIPLPSGIEPESKPKKPRRSRYRRAPGRSPAHGTTQLTRVLRGVPIDRIDKRSKIGCAIRRVHEELKDHLAGERSAVESILIAEVAKKVVILQAVGEFVLTRDSLVTEDGSLLNVVTQYSALQDSLARMLTTLGMQKRAKNVGDVAVELAELHGSMPAESPGCTAQDFRGDRADSVGRTGDHVL